MSRDVGKVHVRGQHTVIRVRLPDGTRPFVSLGPADMSPELAEKRRAIWKTHREVLAKNLVVELEAKREAKRVQKSGAVAPAAITVAELARMWTSGAMIEKYGKKNRLRARRGTRGNEVSYVLNRACAVRPRGDAGPTFGDLAVVDVKEEDIDVVLRLAPRRGAHSSGNTIKNYYGTLHRLFDLAERPCRIRERDSNPVDSSMRPTSDDAKMFSFLLPEEVLALLRLSGPVHNTELSIELEADEVTSWKVLIVLGCYLGLRKTNLVGLRWKDVDLDGGTFVALRTKTGHPITADVHFDTVRAMLRAWKARCAPKDESEPIVSVTARRVRRARQVLQAMLHEAGVTREILFSDDPQVEPIRFHDLRSTFVTWAKRAGLSDYFITQRTGHLTKEMVDRYTRLSTSVAAARFQPFPDVSLPELALATSPATFGRDEVDIATGPTENAARKRLLGWRRPQSSKSAHRERTAVSSLKKRGRRRKRQTESSGIGEVVATSVATELASLGGAVMVMSCDWDAMEATLLAEETR